MIVLASTKVSSAWETLIGAGLGSPLGVIEKLPTMPSWTRVLKSEEITPARVPFADWIAGDQHLGRLARIGGEELERLVRRSVT